MRAGHTRSRQEKSFEDRIRRKQIGRGCEIRSYISQTMGFVYKDRTQRKQTGNGCRLWLTGM